MAPRGDRFRQLRTPGTGDLFEHFGVQAGPPPAPEPGEGPLLAAAACEHCGWYRPLPMAGACPLCGAPGREAPARQAAARGDGTTA